MVPLIDFMKDAAVLIEKFWWGTTKSLKIAAFPDIPEHAQHQGFLGIMLLVLLFGKISYQHIFETVLFKWCKSYI